MEDIRQAVERAKAELGSHGAPMRGPISNRVRNDAPIERKAPLRQATLQSSFLQSRRIVAHDGTDPRSLTFDILRTEVLGTMDFKGWRTLAITSPTPGCGKTFLSINLSLSMARERERQVSLVDFDLRRPQIARTLNLKGEVGVVDVLEGQRALDEATINVRVGNSDLEVIPTTSGCSNASDLVSSSATKKFLDGLSRRAQGEIVVIDLPPLLTGHDVISVLPHIDCVILVAAVGTSKVAEIEQCKKYLQGTDMVRFVLNKAPPGAAHGYYY
ncbi:CpsD/CapB family tyrosine-protein kinase [Bradyrhizobium genosp. A]|uniref:CpsD/CapB family tyrosine-protein kinase n=1 Tax=Bradyrhizobium genosp. A TaxID=83626 RepID=UPI003CF30300